ncbi:uncharacterized protein LOC144227628 isoform X3 [Crocuta crocuta]
MSQQRFLCTAHQDARAMHTSVELRAALMPVTLVTSTVTAVSQTPVTAYILAAGAKTLAVSGAAPGKMPPQPEPAAVLVPGILLPDTTEKKDL